MEMAVVTHKTAGGDGECGMKKIQQIMTSDSGHWVGDGFPVRSLFSYHGDTEAISPFLLFDYAGPHVFAPNGGQPRGVGQHPHRGFETVTIVYDGEVSHRDSGGGGGTIRAGDVQWMTAGRGIVHEEFHSPGYSRTGGPFRMVQLWVNLPAKDKMTPAAYQAITRDEIPVVEIGGATVRVIAGECGGTRGPASTFSPANLWDVRIGAGAEATFDVPEGHNAMLAVLSGHITVGDRGLGAAEIGRLSRDGMTVTLRADGETVMLVLTGAPIREPVVGYGPFVMNTEAEIRMAVDDFNSGRFGAISS